MAGAIKLPIKVILEGKLDSESNKIMTQFGEISKVRLMGRIVAKFINDEGTYGSITIDDGTETIRVKGFRTMVGFIQVLGLGDLVDTIGRVREYQDEIHVIADSIMVYDNVDREMLRLLEIIDLVQKSDPKKAMIELIKKLDEAKLDQIEAEFGDETGMLLSDLKLEGEIYEPRKGVFKTIE
ncbi:MAG: hypothetical protein GOU99_00790 [Candidatus Altiarchaeota archaeon]|nr:hypothetical protein [Candidatus Altiarchaeota archaeon]